QAYQTIPPLTIGELWAVPIMLRLGLVENLRRLAQQMLEAWSHRREAEACAGRLVVLREPTPQAGPLSAFLEIIHPQTLWTDPFIVRLFQALRDHGPDASWLIENLESHFHARGCNPTEVL